jgi:site-specific DNA-methyltransferase (adenine-specific)
MIHSVYSKKRSIAQPELVLDNLQKNVQQKMDGLVLLGKIPSKSIPLVFFDPQYRTILDKQGYGNEGQRQVGRAHLPQMTDETIHIFLQEIERILLPTGHLMWWVDKFILLNTLKLLTEKINFQLVDMITWDKQRMGMGYRTRRCSEYLVIFQKPPIRAKNVWQLHNIPDVWIEKISKGDKNHAHAKPMKLQSALIEAVTNFDDTVVDPAAGGYSVLKAAHAVGRQFLGADLLG